MILRPAEPADALAVAHVHIRAWQVGYRHLLPDAYLDSLQAEDRAKRYTFGNRAPGAPTTLVAMDEGAIRGFATTTVADTSRTCEQGELQALYVDPDHWGRGIGGALVAAARGRLSGQGFTRASLWLLEGNSRGAGFYRADGWNDTGEARSEVVWNITIRQVRYWRDLQAGPEQGCRST